MQCHIGPFKVIEVINDNAYHLRLPNSYPTRPKLLNPMDNMPISEEYKLEQIVGHRKQGKGLVYQVRWKGYDVTGDTRVTTWDLHNAPEELQQYHQQIGIDHEY